MNEPLNILVVTNLYPDSRRPFFGTFVREQVEALIRLHVNVDVLYVDGWASKLNYIKGVFRFWGRLARNRYHLIHAHYVYSGLIARMQMGTPVLVTSHGSDIKGHEGRLLRWLVRRVDAFTVTSMENQVRLAMPGAVIMPCGDDMDLFVPIPRAEARSRLGWPADRQVVLYVGRDHPVKRLDLIRDAVDVVRATRECVHLVTAIGIDHDQIPLCMNAADVLVLASETEGSPVVIKEAMACNLPIVSTDVGDVREIIAGTDGCYICDPNAGSIAEHIRIALDFGRRTNGRENVKHLSTGSIAEHVLELYKSIVWEKTASPAARRGEQ